MSKGPFVTIFSLCEKYTQGQLSAGSLAISMSNACTKLHVFIYNVNFIIEWPIELFSLP